MSKDRVRRDAPLWYRLAYQELMQAERDGYDPSAIADELQHLGEYLELCHEFDPSLNGLYESRLPSA